MFRTICASFVIVGMSTVIPVTSSLAYQVPSNAPYQAVNPAIKFVLKGYVKTEGKGKGKVYLFKKTNSVNFKIQVKPRGVHEVYAQVQYKVGQMKQWGKLSSKKFTSDQTGYIALKMTEQKTPKVTYRVKVKTLPSDSILGKTKFSPKFIIKNP